MMIDPHVHCRDGNQAYKETIKHVFSVADKQGVKKIFDMPNTSPPILRKTDIERRLKLVPKDRKEDYFLYIGATADKNQLEEAVRCYDQSNKVIGIKLYAGKSVGNLAVVSEEKQQEIYKILSDLGYKGVLAVHCEKESYLKPEKWNPLKPITHLDSRPKEAEIESIKDQIKFSQQVGFKGILHIVHVSCPESISIIEKTKIKITCGVTPHHIMWSSEMLERPDGLLYKMNPPLRNKKDVEELRQCLKKGKINWVETDHAPHPIGEKLFPPYFSGFPSLYLYRNFVNNFLPAIGISNKQIRELTYDNIYKRFKNKLG